MRCSVVAVTAAISVGGAALVPLATAAPGGAASRTDAGWETATAHVDQSVQADDTTAPKPVTKPTPKLTPSAMAVATGGRITLSLKGSQIAPKTSLKLVTVSWGDGSKAQRISGFGARPSHTYHGLGIETITVRATDSRKRTGSATARVLVQLKPGVTRRSTTKTVSPKQVQEVRRTGRTTEEITLSKGVSVAVGKVLVAPASPAMPTGMLQVVTKVRKGRDGQTVAETRNGSLDDEFSYYSIMGSESLSANGFFVSTGATPRDYRPALAVQRATPQLGFGEFASQFFDCTAKGVDGTPVSPDFGITPNFSQLHAVNDVSPLGRTLGLQGDVTFRVRAGVKVALTCSLSKSVQLVIPIPEAFDLISVIVRPVLSITFSGSIDVVVTQTNDIDAGGVFVSDVPPRIEDSHFDAPLVSRSVSIVGSEGMSVSLGAEVAIGIGLPIGEDFAGADAGIQATLVLSVTASQGVQVMNGHAYNVTCGTAVLDPRVNVFVEITLPHFVQEIADEASAVKDDLKGLSDAAIALFTNPPARPRSGGVGMGSQPTGPSQDVMAPPKTRLSTPDLLLSRIVLYPRPGDGNGCLTTPIAPGPTATPSASATASATASASPTTAPTGTLAVAFGGDDRGQLGNNTTNTAPQTTPVAIANLTGVSQLAGSANAGYALANGVVYAWGKDSNGELGDGKGDGHIQNGPVRVNIPASSAITQIAASPDGEGAYALAGGSVYYWGGDSSGQDGNGSTNDVDPVTQVGGFADATQIAAGADSGYALERDGTVAAYGSDLYGQLGDGGGKSTSASEDVQTAASSDGKSAPLTGVTSIGAGGTTAYAVTGNDHTVVAWGDGSQGQLGNNTTGTGKTAGYPVAVSNLINVAQITGGDGFVVARQFSTGTVYGWGRNTEGELADGTTVERDTPVQTTMQLAAALLAAGFHSTYAVTTVGALLAWGDDTYGELGNGTQSTSAQTSPVTAQGGNTYYVVYAGQEDAYAVRSN